MNDRDRLSRYSLAGIRIDAIKWQELLTILHAAGEKREKLLILNHNLHSLYLYLTVPEFRAVYAQAAHVYIDGMPVLWLGKLAGLPLQAQQRITFLDCFDRILSHAQTVGWRIFYLGSSPEVSRAGISLLQQRYPGLEIAGHDGYVALEGKEAEEVVAHINTFRPDILFVGMGMPLQEFWIARHLSALKLSGVFTCGATLDYITGHAYKPPAWAGRLGLYGVMRMLHDPKRLWRRYLVEPLILGWKLFFPIMRQRHRGSL